jgi:hypothetical protein
MGWPQTRREATDGRPTHDQVTECGRRPVDGDAVVGWCAGGRIGENPPPGALRSQFSGLLCGNRAITGELTRLFIDTEQGTERHCDPYLDTDAGPATPGAATLGPGHAGFTGAGAGAEIARRSADQIHQGVGAASRQRPVVSSAASGGRIRRVLRTPRPLRRRADTPRPLPCRRAAPRMTLLCPAWRPRGGVVAGNRLVRVSASSSREAAVTGAMRSISEISADADSRPSMWGAFSPRSDVRLGRRC